ncbi:MAG: alpha/beta fold hydrolase [Acidimicrobiales bacterium]
MPIAEVGGLELYYDRFGDPDDPALLLVAGLGAQAISWEDDFCWGFVDRGFQVVRYDHRDVGLSTWVDEPTDLAEAVAAHAAGELTVHYSLADLASDAAGLLDALGIDRAHVVGISMGGMVAQQVAIDHPRVVASLTSLMSTTGESDVGHSHDDVRERMITPPPSDPAEALEFAVAAAQATASPDWWDPAEVRARIAAEQARATNPDGVTRQLIAVVTGGSRAEGLAALDVPTLVIHGELDRVIDPSGGIRTAELVPGAELELVAELGHDLPRPVWPRIIESVTRLAARAATG